MGIAVTGCGGSVLSFFTFTFTTMGPRCAGLGVLVYEYVQDVSSMRVDYHELNYKAHHLAVFVRDYHSIE